MQTINSPKLPRRLHICSTGSLRIVCSWLLAIQALAGTSSQSSPPVAVLEFEVTDDRGQDFSWARLGLADLLQLELQKNGVQTLDRDFIRAVINEQRRLGEGVAKGDLSLGRLLSARALVRGNLVVTTDNRIRLSATAVTVPENQVLTAASAEGLFPDELSQVIAALGSTLANRLKGTEGTNATPVAVPNGYVPSPETLVLFYKGIDLCAQGFPEHAVSWFICTGMVDPCFTQAVLWERKAYQMAGFPHHAALVTNGLSTAASMTIRQQGARVQPSIRTVAVLDPCVVGASTAAANQAAAQLLRNAIEETLLRDAKVQLFNAAAFSSVIGELDLRLSEGFGAQSLSLYDKWLAVDGLIFCSQSESNGTKKMRLEVLDAVSGTVMAQREAAMDTTRFAGLADALNGVLADWSTGKTSLVHDQSRFVSDKALPARLQEKFSSTYVDFGRTLAAVRQGEDRHRQLHSLFMALGRVSNAVWEVNHVIDSAAESKDPAVWLDTFGWALENPWAPAVKHEPLGDLVIDNAPESVAAAQVWFWRGTCAFNRRKWEKAADCFHRASRIHQKIDPPDAVCPYDYTIYRWISLMTEPAYQNEGATSVFYCWSYPQPVVRADEVPWSLFEAFGDRLAADAPHSLAARCVWYNRGTRAFELRQWTNAMQYLEKALDRITDNSECSDVLTRKGQHAIRIWVASAHCLAAFSATELGMKERAKRHLDEADDWMARSGVRRDYPIRMYGCPGIVLRPPPVIRELDFGTYSRDSIWNVLASIRTRLTGQEMKRSDETADFELWVRRFDGDLHSDARTPEQFAAIGSNSLALLSTLVSAWRAMPPESHRTGILTNMPFALGFLSIARQATCATFPVVKATHIGSTSLLRPPIPTMSLASCTNPAAALLKEAAEDAAAAYRVARGLQQMDADTNIPPSELLAYHREAASLLSAAGFEPDLVREFEPFFRPPRLSLVLLPEILTQCGFDAATCDNIVRDAVTRAGAAVNPAPRCLYIFLGDRFVAERRYRDAIEWYRKAVQRADHTHLYLNLDWGLMVGLCRCSAYLSRTSEAEEFMDLHLRAAEEVQEFFHRTPAEMQALAWLIGGQQCQDVGDDSPALLCYAKVRQLTKDKELWANAAYRGADLLRQLGRKEESATLWKELLHAIPTEGVKIWTRSMGPQGGSGSYRIVNVGDDARLFLELFRHGLGDDRHWKEGIGYLAKLPTPDDRIVSIIITRGPSKGYSRDIPVRHLTPDDLEYLKSHGWQPAN